MNHSDLTASPAHGSNSTNSVTDAPLMAATPIWETRGKKRRATGAAAAAPAAEPRSFEHAEDRAQESYAPARSDAQDQGLGRSHEPSMASTATVVDPMTGRPDMTGPEDPGLVTPVARTRTSAPARKSGTPAAALAAGLVALGAVGAAGWYVSQSDDGVTELTPGGSEPMVIAQAPMTGTNALGDSASPAAMSAGADLGATAPAASAPVEAATSERRTTAVRTASVSRTRAAAPAAATSATDEGIDASGTATLPTGPQPYAALNSEASTGAATDATAAAPTTPTIDPAPMPQTPPVTAPSAPLAVEPAPSTPAPVTTPPTL